MNALYLSLQPPTAILEAAQGFAHRIPSLTISRYAVDYDGIADLRTDSNRAVLGVVLADLACPWTAHLRRGEIPPSHQVVRRLMDTGYGGLVAPSFAVGASPGDQVLALWDWSETLPRKVTMVDAVGAE